VAIYGYSVKIGKRSAGKNAVAAAAYRHAAAFCDRATGEMKDYSRKSGVEASFILAPDMAPPWMRDSEQLWNGVEEIEKRKDAQLFREIVLTLPRELDTAQRTNLARDFVQTRFVSQGMIADIAIHNPPAADGGEQPHAHVMLTMRDIEGSGFGRKNRDWNERMEVELGREAWADAINQALRQSGSTARVDHRSLADQHADYSQRADHHRHSGNIERAEMWQAMADLVDREPQPKLGPIALAMIRQGRAAESYAWRDRSHTIRRNKSRDKERQTLRNEMREIADQIVAIGREIADRASVAAAATGQSVALQLEAAGRIFAERQLAAQLAEAGRLYGEREAKRSAAEQPTADTKAEQQRQADAKRTTNRSKDRGFSR